jgi:magnesium transporter
MPRKKRTRGQLRRRTPPGTAPGTIVVNPESCPPKIFLFAYDQQRLVEQAITDLKQVPKFLQEYPVCWLNIDGLGDAKTIQAIGDLFHLHPLALEDVVNTHQRAKVDDYGEYLFIVSRMASYSGQLETEQLSMFLGRNFVVTFQEDLPGDCLNAVRERLRKNQGRLRTAGPDYLAYSLLDSVIDSYFPVLEQYGERIDAMDEQITSDAAQDALTEFHKFRGELLYLRRAIWPHREAMAALSRDISPLIQHETRVHLRDCYDHTIQLIDLLETNRDLCSDLRDYYLSKVSNRLNEIMKVLTIISTIFIPLTFVTGLYGMNFDTQISPWNMPELHFRYGYPMVWAIMISIVTAMLLFFRRRGWLKW